MGGDSESGAFRLGVPTPLRLGGGQPGELRCRFLSVAPHCAAGTVPSMPKRLFGACGQSRCHCSPSAGLPGPGRRRAPPPVGLISRFRVTKASSVRAAAPRLATRFVHWHLAHWHWQAPSLRIWGSAAPSLRPGSARTRHRAGAFAEDAEPPSQLGRAAGGGSEPGRGASAPGTCDGAF